MDLVDVTPHRGGRWTRDVFLPPRDFGGYVSPEDSKRLLGLMELST